MAHPLGVRKACSTTYHELGYAWTWKATKAYVQVAPGAIASFGGRCYRRLEVERPLAGEETLRSTVTSVRILKKLNMRLTGDLRLENHILIDQLSM